MRRRTRTLLTAAATLAVVATAVPASASEAEAESAARPPTIRAAWLAVDAGTKGALDAGDVLKLRFSRNVVMDDPTSVGIQLTGKNGVTMRLENESPPYGAGFSVKGEMLTLYVNLVPEEYPITPLTYPLTITDTWHIVARGGAHLEVNVPGSRDVLIN